MNQPESIASLLSIEFNVQVAMVEAEISTETPTALLIPFAMLTALLIFVHMASLLIATRLLPELEAIIKQPSIHIPSSISKGYTWPVHMVWYLSNIVGIVLFLVEVVIVAYVKFYPTARADKTSLHVGTATLAVVVVLSVVFLPFIVVFFRTISNKKIQLHEHNLEKARVLLENMNMPRPSGISLATPLEDTTIDTSGSYDRQQTNRFINTQV
jgi:hypothetical protein